MQYWELQNSDGKSWIIPTTNVSTALGIYQPSYWKGKLLKRFLPLFRMTKGIYSPFRLVDMPLDCILVKQLKNIFPQHNLEFSIFLGTPSVHKKTVIQIFEGRKILGYAKITEKECVKQLFNHEETILKELNAKGVMNIPRCLFNRAIDEERQLFVMTTEKNCSSEILHSWTKWHDTFIDDVRKKTQETVLFEDSDYAHLLIELNLRADSMATDTREVIKNVVKHIIKQYQGKECEMNVMHGDFTPWNMFKQNDHLFVFDWEYAQRTCPAGLDKWHFFIQSYIYEKHWSAEQISDFIFHNKEIDTDIETIRMYLLAVISIYACRENIGTSSGNLGIYIELLKILHDK